MIPFVAIVFFAVGFLCATILWASVQAKIDKKRSSQSKGGPIT